MTEMEAFGYFLTEYKKRLPETDENKDFHEHIDYMIGYFKSSSIIYQDRWNDWISPNDERYWRNPSHVEKAEIEKKRKVKEVESKKGETEFAVTMASLILSLVGALCILGAVYPTINYAAMLFGLLIASQGVLTILHGLGLIKFSIWGWLY